MFGVFYRMKQERLKKKASGESEILSWVNKSRKLEDKRTVEKQKASRLMKALEEQVMIVIMIFHRFSCQKIPFLLCWVPFL